MNDQQWAYKIKWRKGKAFFFTLLIHALIIGALIAFNEEGIDSITPEFVQDWLHSTPIEEDLAEKAIRP